jgi:hypothetical protein
MIVVPVDLYFEPCQFVTCEERVALTYAIVNFSTGAKMTAFVLIISVQCGREAL